MDRVRFGRALGRGARAAARTMYEAVDAATTPSQAAKPDQNASPRPTDAASKAFQAPHGGTTAGLPRRETPTASPEVMRTVLRTTARTAHASRAARRGLFAPVKRASAAVSLQITGSFFGLFALSFAVAAFRFSTPQHALQQSSRVFVCGGLAVLFAYFAISNFVRARRLSA